MEFGRIAALCGLSCVQWVSSVARREEEAAVAEEQQQQEALVGIEMRNLNYFITKPVANSFCVLEYTKLKM